MSKSTDKLDTSMMDVMAVLDSFEGKRNCVFTIFIPSDIDVSKRLSSIGGAIGRIKNEFKKDQLIKVHKVLESNAPNCYKKKCDKTGLIVCCGLGKDDNVVYFSLKPVLPISKYEYYYDYVFHMNGIRKYFFDNIRMIGDGEGKKIVIGMEKKIEADSAVFGKKIMMCLDMDIIDHIIAFTTDTIPLDMLAKTKSNKANILIFNNYFKKYHNKRDNGCIDPDTKYVGILRYGIKESDMNF